MTDVSEDYEEFDERDGDVIPDDLDVDDLDELLDGVIDETDDPIFDDEDDDDDAD